MATPAQPDDDDPVPKLPRGRGLKLDGPMMFRIGGTLILLIMVVLMRKPCADATSKFVTGFGERGSAVVPHPGAIDVPVGSGSANYHDGLERVGPGATDEEVRAAWERTKARARAGSPGAGAVSGSGSASGSGSRSGSGSVSGSGSASGSGAASGSGSAGSVIGVGFVNGVGDRGRVRERGR